MDLNSKSEFYPYLACGGRIWRTLFIAIALDAATEILKRVNIIKFYNFDGHARKNGFNSRCLSVIMGEDFTETAAPPDFD